MLLATLVNMLEMCVGSMLLYAAFHPTLFALAAVTGALSGAALWWLCTLMACNWNRAYQIHPAQHLLCALASAWTLFFCVAFPSVTAVGSYFDHLVDQWTNSLGVASFTTTSLHQALASFQSTYPFARQVLASNAPDMQPNTLTAATSLTTSSLTHLLKTQLTDRIDWAIFRLRVLLLSIFVALQLTCFGLMACGAHRDIRPAL